MNGERNYDNAQEVHSTAVRAGKRTYFFDIKATRNNDLYLTITESKKSVDDGKINYQKHKVFLYKEDFEKFSDALGEAISKINKYNTTGEIPKGEEDVTEYTSSSVNFDDLD